MRPLSVPWSRWFSNQLDASLAHVLMCFSRHSRVFPSTRRCDYIVFLSKYRALLSEREVRAQWDRT